MKLNTSSFGECLRNLGFDFYCGVPCSFLSNLINYAINDANYVMAANEGDAVAICAGAHMAGKKTVVLMQNSGLTNATSPLTSLNYCFKLPVLGFVSLRGELGLADEPQHELMGNITEKMLELLDIEWEYLSCDMEIAKAQLVRANTHISDNKTFFFVVRKGTFDLVNLNKRPIRKAKNRKLTVQVQQDELPTRYQVLEAIDRIRGSSIVLATTGKMGRELYDINDVKNNFYMVGSMGCVSSIGLGLSLNARDKMTIAIDGDGALLMRMGCLATNAHYAQGNFLHLLIDNNSHDSTGGQFTVSHNLNFVQIAASCGYVHSFYVSSLKELLSKVEAWKANPECTFMYIKINSATKEDLGRPKVKPYEVKDRLMEFICE